MRAAARAFPALLRAGFAAALAYRSELLIWVLTTNMPLVMLALWSAVARDAPVGRFGQADFAAYFLATLVVRMLTSSWVVWELAMDIRQGTLAMKLLRPIHPLVVYAAENLAALPLRAVVALPVALAALAWVGTGHVTHDPAQWAVVPLAMLGAWVLTFCAMALIGTLGFFWESALSVFTLWLALFFVFSGYVLPLELLPPGVYAVVRWLPFRYLLSFPVETLLGLAPRAATLRDLAVQWAWVAVFLGGTLALWRRGLARFAAYGG